MNKAVNLILIILFFICLAKLPYGFYQLVKFAALVGFGVLAYAANKKELKVEMTTYIVFAILFQPIFKISLEREIWNVVDFIIAASLVISIFINTNQVNEK